MPDRINVDELSPNHSKKTITTFTGQHVPIYSNRWKLSKDVSVNLSPVLELMSGYAAVGFRQTLAYYAENHAPITVQNCVSQLKRLLDDSDGKLSVSSLTNYKASLSREKEHYMLQLKGFLNRWYDLGYPGLPSDVIEVLNRWSLTKNKKGEAVKNLDPQKGPLNDEELQSINDISVQLYQQNSISLMELSITLVLTHLGVRPLQLTHLRVKDLIQGMGHDGRANYLVRMPRGKQPASAFREAFTSRAINHYLWCLLRDQAQASISILESNFPDYSVLPELPGNWPLFPNTSLISGQLITEDKLRAYILTDELHITVKKVDSTLKTIIQLGQLQGRDGNPLRLNAYRLRYTVGSRAAREGFGKWVIAALLDHNTTEHAGIYTENHPNFTEIIDRSMSDVMAPMAKAFMGEVVSNPEQALLGDDLRQRVHNSSGELGVCGSQGKCGAVPYACYTCAFFQPLRHAPHQDVLQALQQDRQRMESQQLAYPIIAATDRSIAAVSQVIQLCQQPIPH